MSLLSEVNLYEIKDIDNQVNIISLLGANNDQILLNKNEVDNSAVIGDIILLVKNNRANSLKDRKVVTYPVQKVKGRFSDVKEYRYLKMKVLYDFNLCYLNKKEIEAVEKDPDHIEFEKMMDNNKADIKKLISYNQDENVTPFNHTNYEVQKILNSKKIFKQEIGVKFDWGWSLMEIYQIDENNYVSFKQSSYFRERQRGEFFEISKKAVDFMRNFEDDKDDFLD